MNALTPLVSHLAPWSRIAQSLQEISVTGSSRRGAVVKTSEMMLPSSVHVIIPTALAARITGLPKAHDMAGQCKMFYSDKPKLHIHTNRQLSMDTSDTGFIPRASGSQSSRTPVCLSPHVLSCSEPPMTPTSHPQRKSKSLNGPKGPCPSI